MAGIPNYPGNSKKRPAARKNDTPVKAIVTGRVTRKKQPLGKKFKESFFNTDGVQIGDYILNDVLLPGAKQIVYDIVMNGLGLSLFGQTMSHTTKRHGGSSGLTNYRSASNKSPQQRTISNRAKATHSFDDILIDDKFEAEGVLEMMAVLIDEYDQCTVADLYSMVSITSTHADKKYGWTNISSAYVKRDIQGYILILPKTEVL